MKDLDYGKGYLYPHDYAGNFVSQNYFPEGLGSSDFYIPAKNSTEERIQTFMQRRWEKHTE
jgi:putative ATPase